MENKKNYKFTNKRHSSRAIMSTILGVLSLASLALAVFRTYLADGAAGVNVGIVGFFSTCFAAIGLVLGYLAKQSQDRYPLFVYLGMGLNLLALILVSLILYAGAYGIR